MAMLYSYVTVTNMNTLVLLVKVSLTDRVSLAIPEQPCIAFEIYCLVSMNLVML